MSKLNRIGRGFLDLMGSITQGVHPREYVDNVQPVVDVEELLLGDTLAVYGVDPSHSAAGLTFNMTQGQNELWVLRGFSVRSLALPLTTSVEVWEVGLSDPPRVAENNQVVQSFPILATLTLQTAVAAQGATAAFLLPKPIVMPPGVNLVWRLVQRDGGVIRVSECRATMSRLRA